MRLLVAFAASLALVLSFTVFATPAAAGVGPWRSVIVVLRDDIDSDSVANEHGSRFGALISHVYGSALRGYAARVPERVIALLQRDPRVAFVEEDRLFWATDTVPTGVDRIEADLSSQLAGNGSGAVGTAVAIIDTGISAHPELNIAGGYNCDGFFAFFNRNAWSDGNGHGTHVAGTVAARDNDPNNIDLFNIVGVAPGAPLWAVKVLNSNGSGSLSSIICGINWVAANGPGTVRNIKVANMSLGGSGSDRPSDSNCNNTNNDSMHKAICNAVTKKGVTFVVGAGNSNADFATFVPAAYNEVLTVTAVADYDGRGGGLAKPPTCPSPYGDDDTAATFSSWTTLGNADALHTIAAPGVCINSTWNNKGYATISGTSMASPHAAGTVALCISSGACAGLSPAQIITKLRTDSAVRSGTNPTVESYYGFTDDPNSPNVNRYYGYLVYAGGY